jgi:carbon monoxide dehydrogenase subunit G
MQIQETFTVDESPATVWKFFEDIERVARCVPGVKSVDVLGPDRYKVLATQKVGFISATFEMATQIEQRPLNPGAVVVGKSIKGAIGNLRSKDRVDTGRRRGARA